MAAARSRRSSSLLSSSARRCSSECFCSSALRASSSRRSFSCSARFCSASSRRCSSAALRCSSSSRRFSSLAFPVPLSFAPRAARLLLPSACAVFSLSSISAADGLGVSTFGAGGGGGTGSFLTSGTGFGGCGTGLGAGLGGSGGSETFFTGSGRSCHRSTTMGLATFFCQLMPNTSRPKNIRCTRTARAPEATRPGSSTVRNLTPNAASPAARSA